MKRKLKLWRVELVYLVNGREQIKWKEYCAPSPSQARSHALLIRGAVRVNTIKEITHNE